MRKKNIARAGAAFVLLLGLTGTTVFYQGTATASGAENSEKVAAVNDDASDQEKEDSIFSSERDRSETEYIGCRQREEADSKDQETETQDKQWIRQIQKSICNRRQEYNFTKPSSDARPNNETGENLLSRPMHTVGMLRRQLYIIRQPDIMSRC